jgi:hypothetical protein
MTYVGMRSGSGRSRTFFRYAASNPPTSDDFLSWEALGKRPRFMTGAALRRASGVSAFETAQQARAKALAAGDFGRYIVELRIPLDGPITCERGRPGGGHWTLYGRPKDFLQYVVSVVPV